MSYKINSNLTTRIIDGELVLLNIDKGDFYSLNETGKIIFDNLKKKKNKTEILNELKNEFAVSDTNNFEKDFDELISDLINENIILT